MSASGHSKNGMLALNQSQSLLSQNVSRSRSGCGGSSGSAAPAGTAGAARTSARMVQGESRISVPSPCRPRAKRTLAFWYVLDIEDWIGRSDERCRLWHAVCYLPGAKDQE